MKKKVYGQSQKASCPFCSRDATTQNKQGVPTCIDHKDKSLDGYRCACGEHLDVKTGKYGPFFVCINCGVVSFKKAFEINNGNRGYKIQQPSKKKTTQDPNTRDFIKKEMTKGLPSIDDL